MKLLKKVYEKPYVLIERYELNASIASNCAIVVSNGPAMGTHALCDDYEDPFAGVSATTYGVYNVQFYEDTNCDCYYSSNDSGYWTS